MMEKVLRWQEAFGNKNDATATAMQMLENDPEYLRQDSAGET